MAENASESNVREKSRSQWGGLALMLAAIALVVAPFIVRPLYTIVPAVLVFLYLCYLNLIRRHIFLRNLKDHHCLTLQSQEGEEDNDLPPVLVIAPARNEEVGIEAAVRSMCALDYPGVRVLVVNDHSTDSTGAILDRLASELPNLRVLHNPPLQEGWHGKVNAVWQAMHEPDADRPWILQTDADTIFHPKALRRAMAFAQKEDLDYLTCVVWLDNQSLAEELVMPLAWCGILMRVRRARMNHAKSPALGVGPFMLYRRDSYFECGGHSAFRSQTPEDEMLAATFKQWGGNMGVAWTRDMVRFRIYRGYAQLRDFLTRKTRIHCDDRIDRFLNSMAGMLLRHVLPLPLGIAGLLQADTVGMLHFEWAVYTGAAFAAYCTLAWSFARHEEVAHMRKGLQWAHPLGGVLRIWFTARGMLQALRGKEMDWRGRKHINPRAQG
ncbi:MAG: glycosyltransferase family 2 protein [Candidatus Hydrogenedentes bacterium]|nr:glycosyltransferase family 2 protein [Candidatus Hydrogenedentota bacterium]